MPEQAAFDEWVRNKIGQGFYTWSGQLKIEQSAKIAEPPNSNNPDTQQLGKATDEH